MTPFDLVCKNLLEQIIVKKLFEQTGKTVEPLYMGYEQHLYLFYPMRQWQYDARWISCPIGSNTIPFDHFLAHHKELLS